LNEALTFDKQTKRNINSDSSRSLLHPRAILQDNALDIAFNPVGRKVIKEKFFEEKFIECELKCFD